MLKKKKGVVNMSVLRLKRIFTAPIWQTATKETKVEHDLLTLAKPR